MGGKPMFWVGIVIGLMVGMTLGMLTLAMMAVASHDDDEHDRG